MENIDKPIQKNRLFLYPITDEGIMNVEEIIGELRVNKVEVNELIEKVNSIHHKATINDLHFIHSIIDLTSLNDTDYFNRIERFVSQSIEINEYISGLPKVAAVCTYPVYAELVSKLVSGTPIQTAVVATAFPNAQTFLEVKLKEVEMAVFNGASEIDMVIHRGAFIEKDYERVFHEIASIKKACKQAHLKVILETAELTDDQAILDVSLLAIRAGADFIKTSTGKSTQGATLRAAALMCLAIKYHHEQTGIKIGFKPAGGISNVETAMRYIDLVKCILGGEWLSPSLFRIGASSLANKVLREIDPALINYYN